jgi:hypothetical protein
MKIASQLKLISNFLNPEIPVTPNERNYVQPTEQASGTQKPIRSN